MSVVGASLHRRALRLFRRCVCHHDHFLPRNDNNNFGNINNNLFVPRSSFCSRAESAVGSGGSVVVRKDAVDAVETWKESPKPLVESRFRRQNYDVRGLDSYRYGSDSYVDIQSFVVLLPEVPPDSSETNALMRLDTLPPFDQITPIDCVNGLAKLSIEFETEMTLHAERLDQLPKTFESVIHPLEEKSMALNYAWKTVRHLNYVKRGEKYPKAFRRVYPHVFAAKNEKWANKNLYKAVQELRAAGSSSSDAAAAATDGALTRRLDEFQSRVLDIYELNGRLNGVLLNEKNTDHLRFWVEKVNKERQEFRDVVDDHEEKFSATLTEPEDVKDMPLDLLKKMADDPVRGPWKVSLKPEIYHPFMEHCPHRAARWSAWCAYYDLGGISHGSHHCNKQRVEDLRRARYKQADLLGFKSFAEMSQQTKMAGSVDVVSGFLENMRAHARPVVDEQIKDLQSFAREYGGLGVGKNADLDLYDVPFYRRLMRERLFPDGVDRAAAAEYFEFEHVFSQLVGVVDRLFGLEITREDGIADVYHPDVRTYRIKDLTTGESSLLYLDPFAREDKIAATFFEAGRERCDLTKSSPLGYLNCSFAPSPALPGSPVLLTFEDVSDLFFEMGLALRSLLTVTPYNEIAGNKNVEWDAVDVVGYVMTHLLADHSIVSRLSRHVTTGERMSKELFDQVVGAQRHFSAYDLQWQCFLGAFDIEAYLNEPPKTSWMEIIAHLFPSYFPFKLDRLHFNLPCSFRQIFSEEYPAAYYSQKWAEMVAADAWTKFEEADGGFSLDNPECIAVGHLFKSTFLALGGGVHSTEVFRRFRGNDPSTDAMLRKYGLVS